MKKIFKRIALVLSLTLAVACLCSLFAACGDDNNSNKPYTVTVVYADGSAVDGTQGEDGQLNVQICTAQLNGKLVQCYYIFNVGSDGKATIDNWPELSQNLQYHLQLNNLPAGYTYDENATFLTAAGDLTITLTAES
ncbi:MAG: hypothetical protein ACI4MH_03110 [Candidatus Coproplasma sp.]